MVDYFEVGAVRGDQPGAVRSSRERDEYIKMQVAELVAGEPRVLIDVSEYLARFQPVLLSRCEDGVIFLEGSEEFALRGFCRAAPQFCENNR